MIGTGDTEIFRSGCSTVISRVTFTYICWIQAGFMRGLGPLKVAIGGGRVPRLVLVCFTLFPLIFGVDFATEDTERKRHSEFAWLARKCPIPVSPLSRVGGPMIGIIQIKIVFHV